MLRLNSYWLRQRWKSMHSVKYFYTASSEVTNFPEFVIVGMVDDFQTDYYDSNTKRAEPKQDWMKKVTEDKADYWERQTERAVVNQQRFKVRLDTFKRRFNQTGGLFMIQFILKKDSDRGTLLLLLLGPHMRGGAACFHEAD
uniref:MHC class I-like antigen recognition-like domain-containing protein n=1 Tax=Labrus bergylta TaxID=56723 RepID=A0A3Q3NRD5_9LABR